MARGLKPRDEARIRRIESLRDSLKRNPDLDRVIEEGPEALAELADYEPIDWQRRAMRSEAPRQLYNASRQAGKSLTAATIAVHTALTVPGSLVLMVSRTLPHSGELFRKALGVYKASGRLVPAKSETQLSIELVNGSRIISRPGSSDISVRSYSVDLLLVDEAARVKGDLYLAAQPTLARRGGRLIALSTFYGTRGWFWHEWEHGSDWERFEVPATTLPADWFVPSRDEFLFAERRRHGQWSFQQEYLCIAADAAGQVFRREDVEKLRKEGFKSWLKVPQM